MNKTNIGWTDFSSNPIYAVDKVTGKRGWFCERVSPGCAHCYASTLNGRWGNGLEYLPENADRIEFRLDERELDRIIRRKKPARIFVCDMSDLFHEQVPDGFIEQVFAVMALSPQHTFQVLTKRPERMRALIAGDDFPDMVDAAIGESASLTQIEYLQEHFGWESTWPLPNCWLGVSAENQRWADERIPLLLDTPAAVRFVSCEPLLGPIDLRKSLPPRRCTCGPDYRHCCGHHHSCYHGPHPWPPGGPKLSWVIVGGESGARHRPMEVGWVQSIVDQCDAAGVPVFCKQDSGPYPGKQGRLPDALWARKEMPR